MTDKERILAEIETLQLCTMDEHMNFYSQEAQGEYNALVKIETFINSMQEEPVSEDLEEEKTRLFGNCKVRKGAFELGAAWKEQQIMKDAVEGEIGEYYPTTIHLDRDVKSLKRYDKVKLIIIKQE